jgi:hypothetical protein
MRKKKGGNKAAGIPKITDDIQLEKENGGADSEWIPGSNLSKGEYYLPFLFILPSP